MVKVECDLCGGSCDNVATFIQVERISNYATCPLDVGANTMGTTEKKIKLALCQDCYGKLGLPNIYDIGKKKVVRNDT